jgi:OOP family OmpA-OmpF porin
MGVRGHLLSPSHPHVVGQQTACPQGGPMPQQSRQFAGIRMPRDNRADAEQKPLAPGNLFRPRRGPAATGASLVTKARAFGAQTPACGWHESCHPFPIFGIGVTRGGQPATSKEWEMDNRFRQWTALGFAAMCAGVVPHAAQAQARGETEFSLLPYTRSGYVGLNLGSPQYSTPCGVGFSCDDPNTSVRLYTGGWINPNLGIEFAYLHMGSADRAGGTVRAQGVNLSLVGRVPFAERFGVFGKLGTTYGRTRQSAAAGSGVTTGNENGFGVSYGFGASWDVARNWTLLVEWEHHDFKFASGREPVKAASLGVQYRF